MIYNPMSRRMFLRGLGGTLAIPLLPSLLPARAFAAGNPEMRFVMTLGMFGRDITRWYPDVKDSEMQTQNGALVKSLRDIQGDMSFILGKEFDTLRGKMNILRGLDILQGVGHNNFAPTTACGGAPSEADSFGYSIDCVLEESTKFYSAMPAIGVIRSVASRDQGGFWGDFASYSYTSKNVRGQYVPAEWDVKAVYNKLFNPTTISQKATIGKRSSATTNAVYENFKQTMSNRRISSIDKYKLEAYMQQVSEIDKRLNTIPGACGASPGVPGSFSTNDQLHSLMIDLEVAALACGLTKVVMHSITHWEADLNNPSDYHAAAHAGGQNAPNQSYSLASIANKWQLARVAEFMKKLDSVQESNGTLLDNTVFIYSNEDSTGSHDKKDMPVILAGAKSSLKNGFYIDYRPRPIVLPNPYSSTALGRPYNQLLVTAFKALGLKEADYQKFGLKGFGRYENIAPTLAAHYAPFTTPSVVDQPLPFLMG